MKWHRDYNECVLCNSDEYPFYANGRCESCYKREYSSNLAVKEKISYRCDGCSKGCIVESPVTTVLNHTEFKRFNDFKEYYIDNCKIKFIIK